MKTAKWVKEIEVIDPDVKLPVEMTVFKHEDGGMFAVDASYIDSIDTAGSEDNGVNVPDPFSDTRSKVKLTWEDKK